MHDFLQEFPQNKNSKMPWNRRGRAAESICLWGLQMAPKACGAFRRSTGGQPWVAEALCSSGPPLRVIIQHANKEVWESRGLLQQEVVFLHQNIVKAAEPQRTNTTQLTWMHSAAFSKIIKANKMKKVKLLTYLCSWSNLQSIYPIRQQLVEFYQAAPWSGRYDLSTNVRYTLTSII